MKISSLFRKAVRFAASLAACLSMAAPAAAAGAEGDASLIAPADARADLDALYDGLRRAHFDLYARRPKPAYDQLYRRTRESFRTPVTRLELVRRLQAFTAFGRIAHARIDETYAAYGAHMATGGRTFPLELRIVGDRMFVRSDRSGTDAARPGDQVLSIEGVPARERLRRSWKHLSADNAYMAAALLELDLPMTLWLEAGAREAYQVTISRDGRSRRIVLPARTRAEMASVAVSPGLDLGAKDRTWRMLDDRVAYLRPGPFYNAAPDAADPYDVSGFRAFVDEAFGGIRRAGAQALLIDLRDNPGGDSSFSDLMVGWFADRPYSFASAFQIKVSPETVASNAARLPQSPSGSISHQFAALFETARTGEVVRFDPPQAQPRSGDRFDGEVYVLINRNSYSNAVAVAATVQDYGFGTILGEETSDLATTYGAMESFTLPRSGVRVGYPKAFIVRPDGSLAPRGVRPDAPLTTPVIETPSDVVLSRAHAVVLRGLDVGDAQPRPASPDKPAA